MKKASFVLSIVGLALSVASVACSVLYLLGGKQTYLSADEDYIAH